MKRIAGLVLLLLGGCGYPVLVVPVIDLAALPYPMAWDRQCPTMTIQNGVVYPLKDADLVNAAQEDLPPNAAWYTLGRNIKRWDAPASTTRLACRYADVAVPLLLPVSDDTRQCFLVAWDRPASVLETAVAWCAGPPVTMGAPPHRGAHP